MIIKDKKFLKAVFNSEIIETYDKKLCLARELNCFLVSDAFDKYGFSQFNNFYNDIKNN